MYVHEECPDFELGNINFFIKKETPLFLLIGGREKHEFVVPLIYGFIGHFLFFLRFLLFVCLFICLFIYF